MIDIEPIYYPPPEKPNRFEQVLAWLVFIILFVLFLVFTLAVFG